MTEKLSEKIYIKVRTDILTGKYSSREFISESQIAGKYGVSKAPVKEALHTLADQGYIVSYPRRGYMINTYSIDEINKMQEIRRELETLCIKRIVKNAADAQINDLRFYVGEDANSFDPQQTINARFHLKLAELSGNEFLTETLRPLILRTSMSQINARADTDHFDHIVAALQERDTEAAVKWLLIDIHYL